ncbi:dolichyl-diphosphooligosaccharide--protein glycosyltransferase subunit 2 [Leisingera daeponensis]|uniref:dolichyl-diphosphooligosaccharide--protein glycosyltransferase subunit 2 n=1 Tax=Leisingera daeponensis TaxID=405746 RepID=UPI001C95E95E|nr:dolichyl-diphosphooligosaccharide--protein glycosyltransferase subunit 2 [Leisingera daeponensis]MBY6058333.1 dolichyl-diphosphooligosaccharide--protein glycosyltransferase subunit 2 [Leisingera daeponensis]
MLILAPIVLLLVGACFGVLPGWLSGALFLLFSGGLIYEYWGTNSVDWATLRFSMIFLAPLGVPALLAGFFLGRWARGGEIEE